MVRGTSILLLALLTGCSTVGGPFGGRVGTPSSVQPSQAESAQGAGEGEGLAIYLQTLRDLIEGDPVVKADAFRNAADAANASPTTTNRLNLALALATPGHPSSNPLEAQKQLGELLASGDALLPEERTLALVHLKEVEQRLILNAEAQRLQRAAQAATAQRNDQSAQRLQAALEENRQLKAELEEAKAKLDAITNIERSIRDRENGSNPR
jgi:multidrug efflux pump subunit AcrA (membrane-fusion protein)